MLRGPSVFTRKELQVNRLESTYEGKSLLGTNSPFNVVHLQHSKRLIGIKFLLNTGKLSQEQEMN